MDGVQLTVTVNGTVKLQKELAFPVVDSDIFIGVLNDGESPTLQGTITYHKFRSIIILAKFANYRISSFFHGNLFSLFGTYPSQGSYFRRRNFRV